MQKICITQPGDADQRLDKFLKKYLPNAPLGAIYKFLRTGKIKINWKKKDQTYVIQLNDEITFFFLDDEMLAFQKKTWVIIPIEWSHSLSLQGRILYEDEYILVINKPAHLNVHPGDHKTKEISLIEWVHDYLGSKYSTLTFKPSLVHRIDRDTSGCILIAKEKKTLEALLSELQEHKIEKIYHAIVAWIPEKPRGTIRAKLLRIENAQNESKVRIDANGQNAVTHYRTLQTFPHSKESFSLLECVIETWRMHQIRVHLASIGLPIIGDRAYGNISFNSFFRRKTWVSRQLLHAKQLIFTHPIHKTILNIEAPYESDFNDMLTH